MDANAQRELYAIKMELNAIIRELENISAGVRRDFSGIGTDRCSNTINNVLNQYYYVRTKLNNLDTSTVNENFGGGGTASGGGSSRRF